MSGWRIESLAGHPQLVATLAAWHHAEWGSLMAPWSLDEARAELLGHVDSDPFPVTFVALDASGTLAGSISLVETDAPEFAQYTPWLASLYVAPPFRRRGLGEALVRRLVDHAAGLGFQRLYLFTPGSPALYQRGGFAATATLPLAGHSVTLMERALP